MNKLLINGQSFSVSNLEKVLFPTEGYTKGELLYYYLQVAPYMLSHLKERPMVFTRYPDGIKGKSFYQKDAPAHLPDWITTFPWYSEESQRELNFILIEDAETLAWLANQACLEFHPWLSRVDLVDYPDYIVFDLDPSPHNSFAQVAKIAQIFQDLFHELRLSTYLKTSGSEGLHIFLPVQNSYSYEEVRNIAHGIASIIVQTAPDMATIERRVSQRGKRVYIDYLQNVRGKTVCAPYSVRARPGAPVSTPITWDELPHITPQQFTIKTILTRLQSTGDLFYPVLTHKQSLENTLKLMGMATKG
ncbi:MAG: non-homologous end-joining DNA ligase [Syntrophomonadaceae bacterium]|jgi:bifunctional non-homologous end joining protein LigD